MDFELKGVKELLRKVEHYFLLVVIVSCYRVSSLTVQRSLEYLLGRLCHFLPSNRNKEVSIYFLSEHQDMYSMKSMSVDVSFTDAETHSLTRANM